MKTKKTKTPRHQNVSSRRRKKERVSSPARGKKVSVEQLHRRIAGLRSRIREMGPATREGKASSSSIHVSVFRFNAGMDYVSRMHEYTAEKIMGESVLDLLTRLKHTQDGSLTFRGSCGTGGCGTCGINVNGKPVLGCLTQVSDALSKNETLQIGPLDRENVIRDLVCSENPFFNQLKMVKSHLVSRKSEVRRKHRMLPSEIDALGNAPHCLLCGICNASAGVHAGENGNVLGPAAFVKGYRYWKDSRDGDVSRVERMKEFLPVPYSLEKANTCPRDIFPGKKIEALIKEKIKKGD